MKARAARAPSGSVIEREEMKRAYFSVKLPGRGESAPSSNPRREILETTPGRNRITLPPNAPD